MPAKTHPHFTLHTTDALAKHIRERAKAFPSVNAYITHCIVAEMLAEDSRLDREIAASVRRTIELVNGKVPPGTLGAWIALALAFA
jgi:hypothetical protein